MMTFEEIAGKTLLTMLCAHAELHAAALIKISETGDQLKMELSPLVGDKDAISLLDGEAN